MLKVGLTGNIGSGKTLVCQIFESLGVSVFYADKIALELYDNSEIRNLVKQVFGDDVYDSKGKLIRQKLASLVFHNEQALRKINGIIHPGVVTEYLKWLDKRADEDYTVHEAAILFESGLEHEFDHIIMVSAPEEVRLQRVLDRDGVDENEVKARMKNQWPEEKKVGKADFVIINDGKQFLIPQILKIHNQLKIRYI